LLQRGGLFAKIVDLMDVEVIPSSNPYAWLRLTPAGLRKVIEDNFSEGESAETWVEQTIKQARQGDKLRFPIKMVETITDALPPEYYRVGEEVRSVKRDFGQRKGGATPARQAQAGVGGLKHPGRPDLGQREDAGTPAHRAATVIDGVSKHLSQIDFGQPENEEAPAPKGSAEVGDASGHFSQLDLWPAEGEAGPASKVSTDFHDAVKHLGRVSRRSADPVLRTAAKSLEEYLQ
jgi:hypothetical protein